MLGGLAVFIVPGIYLLFALCMFSFAVLFEGSTNPIRRSFALTHDRPGRALARWGILAAVVVAFEVALGLLFDALGVALLGARDLAPADMVSAIQIAPSTLPSALSPGPFCPSASRSHTQT
ncbi:hypothetical protein ACIRL3_25695 [Streptomyces sp. NPDC102384]|uniref:hypothetical protein n=1 Tax=Streptomyces sp. NPDC102384 TaxID=3366166 RepID=UPI003813DDD7